jgi:Transposase IS4
MKIFPLHCDPKKMANRRLRNGIGAQCSALKRYLHSRPIIDAKYPNATPTERLDSLLAIRRERKAVNKRNQWVIIFRHDDFENVEIYCVEKYCKVTKQGPEDAFFIYEAEVQAAGTGVETVEDRDVPTPALGYDRREDIAVMRAMNFDVDDDNEPAPENIPSPNQTTDATESIYSEWKGSSGFCNRRQEGHRFERAKLNGAPGLSSRLELFMIFIPRTYLESVLIPSTNIHLPGAPLTLGELVQFFGLWMLMATTMGASRRDFWDPEPPSMWTRAPFRLHTYMSRTRFDSIIKALTYTNIVPPAYRDKFHQVRQLLEAFSENMKATFIPSWVSCLDESMSIWTSKWTCPGFMFVPRKPHPMGNEYHSICCGESGIMFDVELVEGKDSPSQRAPPMWNEKGKTVGLLLRLCKSIFSTGKVVILDSGFCILQGIVELHKVGVFASALIKKRRYWPKYILGDAIKQHFDTKAVGECDRLPGVLDGVKFDIFGMKEPDYVMMLMSTYGSLIVNDGQKLSHREYHADGQTVCTTFKYTEPFANHFIYRGAVDDHNNKRHDGGSHQGISLETTWNTQRWENRVFAFVLAVTEVNAYLARRYFFKEEESFMEFRKKLSYAMTRNTNQSKVHELVRAPKNAKFEDGEWRTSYKRKYQQHHCTAIGCKNRVRTVCICNRARWICTKCFADHCIAFGNAYVEES